jgi:hypothetical protein
MLRNSQSKGHTWAMTARLLAVERFPPVGTSETLNMHGEHVRCALKYSNQPPFCNTPVNAYSSYFPEFLD